VTTESIGDFLKRQRETRRMSLPEVSRVTRIPLATLESIESDRYDELPGEVFVRGFLRSYAKAVGVIPDEVLARYTASRRVAFVTPLPAPTPLRVDGGRRFGVAIAFVLLLILFTLALSFVLKPRGHDLPAELSERTIPAPGSSSVGLL
jgi:cytoskeletal protein RodZ